MHSNRAQNSVLDIIRLRILNELTKDIKKAECYTILSNKNNPA